jgi:hypothetical protein
LLLALVVGGVLLVGVGCAVVCAADVPPVALPVYAVTHPARTVIVNSSVMAVVNNFSCEIPIKS